MKKILLSIFALSFSGILFAQVPANDNCSSATNLGSLPTPAVCPSGIGASITVSGTTVNGTASNPYPYIIGCAVGNPVQQAPAIDVWYSFVATGTILNVTIASTFAQPNMAVWTGPCGSQTAIQCGSGNNAGNLSQTIQPLTPGQTYYIQISGNTTSATGTFNLTLSNDMDCNNCLTTSSFTASPNPVNGTYQAGQTVTFCFTVNGYVQVSSNWLHGIQWTFGPGWNMATLVPTSPPQCPYDPTPGPGNAGDGAWGWYASVTSSATGNTYGPGFFFDNFNVAGNNPGQNFGDPTNGSCTWTFCVQITTNAACVQGQSLNIVINTLADGESGSWTSPACAGDPNFTFLANSSCCSVPTIASTNLACNGGSNGSATATPTGANSPWTYTWNNSVGTFATVTSSSPNTQSGLTAGTYTVSILDNNGCTTSQTFTITQPTAVAATQSQVNVTCNGSCNGSATVVASGGTPGYTYSWAPSGGTGATASARCAGTYTCTITDANGCSITKSFTITQPTVVAATQSQVNATCNGTCNGSATVVASGGTPGYTYSWAPSGGTAATASSLCAGNYTCTITDANGCSLTKSFAITQPTAVAATQSQVNLTCNTVCNGSATVVPSGGTPGYTYSWAPSGGTAATASSLCAGNYTCTITDANGCSLTKSFAITQPTVVAATQSQVNTTCNGTCNGSATVVASGGTPGYTYSWAPSGGTAATASSLCAGNYTCTITDANGCSLTKSFAITQPTVVAATQSQVNATCNGTCNGSATVVASGGTPGYTYSWAPSGGTAATASSLCAGNYTCTITDANGCSLTKSFAITQPTVVAATQSQVNTTCNGTCNGSATVVASGGTPGYTYSWAPSGGTAATASSLCAGNYTCTITDANGCTLTKSFAITQPTAIASTTAQVNVTCNASCNGSATVSPSGGTPGYTFSWAPSGGTAATASSLCAGNYTCTITDANGCTLTKSFAITQPTAVSGTATSTPTACGGSNGTATASPSGGTPGYTYSWAPSGGTSATASGLTAGSYTCTITDANGCTGTAITTVNNNSGPTVTIASSGNNSCFGGSNGTATANVSGGTGPYTYSWAPSGGTAITASGLAAGSYTCTVTDANGCISSVSVTITEPTQVTGTTSSTPANCGGNNGSATVVAGGGSPGYTYSWAPSGGTAATASNLIGGNYTVTITDANGCAITSTVSVATSAGPTSSIASSSNILCFGGNTGSATASASGGTPGYTYSWAPIGGSAATGTNMTAGSYTCTITDANGCTTTSSVTLTEPPQLTASATSTPANCSASDGTATVTPGGGTAGYTYSWAPSGGTGATENNIPAGTYTCTVTDANGCTTTATTTVTNLSGPTASITSSSDVSCNGGNNGSALSNASGGSGTYTYAWTPVGGTNANATGLTAGTYTCTITDSNGCLATTTVTITEPTAIVTTINVTPIGCNATTSATANVSGGTAGYTYSWSSGGTAATENNLAPGNYTVTVTDANGCVSTQTCTVGPSTTITATSTFANSSCFGSNNGTATVTPSGGTTPYTYSWSPSGGTSATASGLTPGTYTCTITDANGCTTTQTATVTEPTQITSSATSTNIQCNGASTGTASVTASGGTGGLTYSWTPSGGTASSASSLTAGTYTCTITDANGCTITQTVTLTQPPALTVTANSDSICPGMPGTITANGGGGTGPYSYSWSNGPTTASQNVNPAATTVYTVTITDANGCTSTATSTVSIKPAAVANITSNASSGVYVVDASNPLCFDGTGTNLSSWNWDLNGSPSTQPNPCVALTAADTGTFCANLIVDNIYGCSDTAQTCIEVTEVTYVIPNVFTPNADNINDVFMISNSGMKTLHCEIFDRWGVKMYSWDGPGGGWDGRTTSGMQATDGVYYWVLHMEDYAGKTYDYHGFVQLIRGK
ncbi:MAG: gliding motility-associated C-terminal domain-containing protein [Bacteroidetes bacterium]|nr:gliding motility-associated C-terminal domain-containing protein [Bacteroidota bacterium]